MKKVMQKPFYMLHLKSITKRKELYVYTNENDNLAYKEEYQERANILRKLAGVQSINVYLHDEYKYSSLICNLLGREKKTLLNCIKLIP